MNADEQEFKVAYAAYPKKRARADALKAWKSVRPPLQDVLDALAWQSQDPDWKKEDGKFVPYMGSWIRGRRWEDEAPTHARQAKAPVIDGRLEDLLDLAHVTTHQRYQWFSGAELSGDTLFIDGHARHQWVSRFFVDALRSAFDQMTGRVLCVELKP